MNKLELLKEPLNPEEIEWKIQSYTNWDSRTNKPRDPNKDVKTIVVPYINNRAVMSRLDKACGLGGWRSEFKETSIGKGGFLCTLSIKIDNEWVSKTDGASISDIAPVKGGISDSMKRCAVQWGLGRDLYDYPKIMVNTKIKYIESELLLKLSKITLGVLDGRELNKIYILTAK